MPPTFVASVVVEVTRPEEFAKRSALLMPASVSPPVDENVEVAVAPKYAPLYAEKRVVDAPPWNCWRAVHVLALPVEAPLPERPREEVAVNV